jgi:LmbE family N-acetylglucosaminyl deacetylase
MAGADRVGKALREAGDVGQKYWMDAMTPAGRQVAQNPIFEDDPDSVIPKLGETPVQSALMSAAQSLPSTAAMAIPGGIGANLLTRGAAGLAARGIGGETMALAGGAIPATTFGGRVAAAAPSAIGMGVSEGVTSAAMNAAQIKSEIEQAPQDQIDRHPAYQELRKTLGDEGARARLADLAEREVFGRTALSTGLIGMATGGGALGGAYRTAKSTAKTPLWKEVAKGVGNEALQEAAQSGPEQYIENLAKRDYLDPNQRPMAGVIPASLSGGVTGGLMGFVMGGAGKVAQAMADNRADQEDPGRPAQEAGDGTAPVPEQAVAPPVVIDPNAGPLQKALSTLPGQPAGPAIDPSAVAVSATADAPQQEPVTRTVAAESGVTDLSDPPQVPMATMTQGAQVPATEPSRSTPVATPNGQQAEPASVIPQPQGQQNGNETQVPKPATSGRSAQPAKVSTPSEDIAELQAAATRHRVAADSVSGRSRAKLLKLAAKLENAAADIAVKTSGQAPVQAAVEPVGADPVLSPGIQERMSKRLAGYDDARLAKAAENKNTVIREAAQAEIARRAAMLPKSVSGTSGNPVGTSVATNGTPESEARPALSVTGKTRPATGSSTIKSNLPPNRRGATLLNAILRITGGDGIHPSMALDTTGDTSNRQPKLRGLFTNRGSADLGELAMHLRESENFDVRDGEHLAELIRRAAAGERITDMETQQREAEAARLAEYKSDIRKKAEEFGLKTAFVKFSDIEERVISILSKRQNALERALDQRSQDIFDSLMSRSENLVSDEEVDALLLDLHQKGLRGREFQDEASRVLREWVDAAERIEEGNRKLQEAADDARDEETPWIGQDDEGSDSQDGGDEKNSGRTGTQPGEGFALSGQTNQEAADAEVARSAEDAEKAAAKPMGGLSDAPLNPPVAEPTRNAGKLPGGTPLATQAKAQPAAGGAALSQTPAAMPAAKAGNVSPNVSADISAGDSLTDKQQAAKDLNDALGDLADIFGKRFRANMMPEQEQKLFPVMVRVFDAAFRLGYHSFKDAARFVLKTIREKIGAEVADGITIDHLQGAYIAMSGGKDDATSKRDVIGVESKTELEQENVTDERGRIDLERDSQNQNAENGVGKEGIRNGSGPNGRSGGQGVPDAEKDGGGDGGVGISGHEALAAGAASDNAIHTGSPGLSPGSAGNSVSVGSGDLRIDGPPIEPDAATPELRAKVLGEGFPLFNRGVTATITPADSAIYNMAQEGKSAAEILSFIGKASRRPFNRYLAAALRKLGVTSTITLDSQGGFNFGDRSYAQKYAAAYSPRTDTVLLFTPREAERHILHELVHAATLKALAAGGPAAARMRVLLRYAQKDGSLSGQYGLSSLDEFVAEAFSNPRFQQALQATPAPNGSTIKNAWEWFVRAVARILGMKTARQETLLDQVMRDGAALMRENAAMTGRLQGSDRYAIAWHGTPHVWAPEPGFPHGRPRLDKMGTGEGAQAYGWGWYSAESHGVAHGYRDRLSGASVTLFMLGGERVGYIGDAKRDLIRVAKSRGYSVEAAVIAAYELKNSNGDLDSASAALWVDNPTKLQNEASNLLHEMEYIPEGGSLYQLDIPDDVMPHLLDWDKPLSEQTPEVQESLRSEGYEGERPDKTYGDQLYRQLSVSRTAKSASETLLRLGIPGLRYLDGQSRADGKGTYNYVIWDQPTLDRIALLERNGEKLDAIRAADEAVRFNLDTEDQFAATEREAGGRAAYDKAKAAGRTKLNYGQWVQVRTPAFKAWFGDWEGAPANASKVVDPETGEPRVVYHGSESIGITKFDGSSLYLTTSKKLAKQYTGWEAEDGKIRRTGEVVPLFVNTGEFSVSVDAQGARAGDIKIPRKLANEIDEEEELIIGGHGFLDDIAQKAEGSGYTAVIFNDVLMNGKTNQDEVSSDVVVVFRPEQIKSAIGNRGTFDANDPDIRYNIADDQQGQQDDRRTIPTTAPAKAPIDGARLRQLRRDAAALERPEHAVFLRVTDDGMAIATGPKGVRVPETFRRFAADNGLTFVAQRGIYGNPRSASAHASYLSGSGASHPMPGPYRESGAMYFGEMGDGNLDRADSVRFSVAGTQPAVTHPASPGNLWQAAKAKAAAILTPGRIDKLIYELQDKYVDLRRIRDHIRKIGGTITDLNDAYLGEELYHKRLSHRTDGFLKAELRPLLVDMRARGVSLQDLETYLHARHAPEANAEMARRNPSQAEIDAGQRQAAATVRSLELHLQRAKATGAATSALEQSLNDARGELAAWNGAQAFRGTEDERRSLSGMSDAAAAAIMDGLTPERRADLEALANRVDAINEGTLQLLQNYGLMSRESLDTWRRTYRHYIPLHRDEAHPDSVNHPIGQGFSTKGDASRRRTGSNQQVTHILGHIAMQREAALTRGEKNNVMRRLYLMARQNPLPDVWKVGTVPTTDIIDKATGFVKTVPDPMYKNLPNVIMLRIAGKDVAITMNEHNPEALRMANALKNLDVDDLHYLIPAVGKATRWFASINTQYNPIFGVINMMRDLQTGALNLSTTELAGKQGQVLKDSLNILKASFKNYGRLPTTGQWAALSEELNMVGGMTGYRDLFLNAEDRGNSILKEMKALDHGSARRAFHAVASWLSDYNEAMETAVRLAAYKAGLDSGMTKERAASLAKNLTVNFNRKGRQTRELGALYAFFNAAVQGTTRMAQTLAGPAGRKIMAGGVLVGAISAVMGIAAMGGGDGEDDEWSKIPEFVKERSLIIPISNDKYIAIPMPLGFHFLPNIGRLAVEMAAYKDKTSGKQMASLFTVLADAFNPLGGSSPPLQMAMPTVLDPFVALAQNRDWTGRPIYIENRNSLDPQPGTQRAKDSATPFAKVFAQAINAATGGTEYTPGGLSPTPDQIDYVIGQLTGGIGREAGKVLAMATAPFTGEELPSYKIPLAGRLYGSTSGASGQSEAFYENILQANAAEREIKGRLKDGTGIAPYMLDKPYALKLAALGNSAERQISKLREIRRGIVSKGGPDSASRAREVNERMAAVMRGFNRQAERMQ